MYFSILISINYNDLHIIIPRLLFQYVSPPPSQFILIYRAVDINIFFHSNFNVIVIVHRRTHTLLHIFIPISIYIILT